MRLGVLGGTFDPIHLGHLRAAQNARVALGLEQLLLVPARVPPHRPEPRASAFDRFAMVALATAGAPQLAPSSLELERPGPSYTVDTLAALRETGVSELCLVVGSDTLSEMAGWRDAARIFALCTIAVVRRPGSAAATRPAGAVVREVEGAGLAISASAVRERAAARGGDLAELVPPAVAEYIEKRGLYR